MLAPLEDETTFLVSVVNRFSRKGHPVATPENLQFFVPSHVTALVRKALGSGRLSYLGMKQAKKYLAERNGNEG